MKYVAFAAVLLIVFLAVFSFIPKSVLADGMMIMPDPYSGRWDYSNESNQQAFINYDNGLQKMIISVGFEGENSKSVVWLFPVPSDPNKVAIDIVKNLPQLNGEEISRKAKSNLDDTMKFLQMTQLYTIPFVLSPKIWRITNDINFSGAIPQALKENIKHDVVVYEHLDKEGISSEIITAKTANGLYNYLKSKGLKIEKGSIPVLDNYIGKEYSFVVSWISSSENIISTQRGIFVTFPTKNIYFPMLPTSVYGSKIIPATIRVIGHVSPKVFQDIKNYTKIEYYINGWIGRSTPGYLSFTDDYLKSLKNFYDIDYKQNQDINYTKIEINAPSKFLTEDLWINNQVPIKTYYLTYIAKHSRAITKVLLILSSIIAGILAGLIVFRDLRKNPIKLGLIGLLNYFTILGLLIIIIFVGTKNKNKNLDIVLAEIKQKRYFWRRSIAIILFFVAILFLAFGVFILSLLTNEPNHILIIVYILLITILMVGFLIAKRIKPEDKNLFEQLKLSNYSSWLFLPKDKMKYAFVPIFSILFLIISWLLVKLVGFTI